MDEELEKKELSSSSPVYSEDDVEKAMLEKKEQIEEKAKEEKEAEFATEKEQLLAEKEEKETELEKLKEEVDGLKDKDRNFENLRKKIGSYDKTKDEVKKLQEQIDQLKEEPIKAIKEEFVNTNIGDNEEDTKVFNYYYERLKVDAPDRETARKAMADALLLFQKAKGLLDINPFSKVLGTHGRPMGIEGGLTAMQKEFFGKFGVDDKLIEKVKNKKEN